ncbi:hypothetical protein Tcan_07646 [Toxocara canis]|uniref:EB domain-containing protein n=1 Tax=Toxocara canis TaxID=6265 RepID=A0A0B2V8U5_TOXCA|nr:hypothetical protein Tcan_07646 [Toxocara canis]
MLFLCFELLVLFLSETLAQLTELRAPIVAVGSSGCRLRPFGCDLNCPNGFRWGVAGACSCLCNDEPCQQKRCAANELCRRGEDGGVQCVPRIGRSFCCSQSLFVIHFPINRSFHAHNPYRVLLFADAKLV